MRQSWDELISNPAKYDKQKVLLEGMLMGSPIEQLTPPEHLQATFSPGPEYGAKVFLIINKPSRERAEQVNRLAYYRSPVEVEGIFEYDPKGEDFYIGRIVMSAQENSQKKA